MRSYNRYLAVAARVVRRSLKEGPRLQAERRGEMDLRFAKWEVSTVCTNASLPATDIMHLQNGKQGENKSLASENASAMAQAAGQEAK
jgi:F-type H+-transporting ATPase subunit epsilon